MVYLGDCLDMMAEIPDNSIDSCVCDPPYGLGKEPPIVDVLAAWLDGREYVPGGGGFMGKKWDAFIPGPMYWREVHRVLKPGGYAVVFAGQRTVDIMGVALRLSGFHVRDLFGWQFWSGFPKSMDVSKAIDKAAGAEREVVGDRWAHIYPNGPGGSSFGVGLGVDGTRKSTPLTAPATPSARLWSGFGTALKPSIEPALIVRKPFRGTVASNVTTHGTAAINIDGCRYPFGDSAWPGPQKTRSSTHTGSGAGAGTGVGAEVYGHRGASTPGMTPGQAIGRWPANVYACPKVARRERERGCGDLPARSAADLTGRKEVSAGLDNPRASSRGRPRKNTHPTVKPVRLLRWLCRLVTPPGGVVLDPFAGSGSCGVAAALEGFGYRGAELGAEYHTIAEARIEHAMAQPAEWADTTPGTDRKGRPLRPPADDDTEETTEEIEAAGQACLWGEP